MLLFNAMVTDEYANVLDVISGEYTPELTSRTSQYVFISFHLIDAFAPEIPLLTLIYAGVAVVTLEFNVNVFALYTVAPLITKLPPTDNC